MTIITLSRELGSDGTAVGRQVAKELGYLFVDKTTFERILHEYGLIQFEDLYDSAPGFWARFDSTNLQIVSMLNKAILGIARLDDVLILGRGGYAALNGYADVLHIRIQAPFSLRAQRVMAREGLDDIETAERITTKNDTARAAFVRRFYDADFYTASQFHLVLDTSAIPANKAAPWIVEAARLFKDRTLAEELTTQSIGVDPILASVISKVLATMQD